MTDLIKQLEAWADSDYDDCYDCNGGRSMLDLLRPVIEAAEQLREHDCNCTFHSLDWLEDCAPCKIASRVADLRAKLGEK